MALGQDRGLLAARLFQRRGLLKEEIPSHSPFLSPNIV